MVEALRRLLWLAPLAVLGAFALFLALSQSPRVRAHQDLPVFYNAAPESARSLTEQALGALLADRPGAAERLQELGGAALPHLLPRLATLPIQQRRRIAEALRPLRGRLEQGAHVGLVGPRVTVDRSDPSDRELLYWERFYQDHDLDFRPISVARLARRLAERPLSLREGDLLVLDTYALPSLVSQLGRVSEAEDIERLSRLVPAIAHASGRDYALPPHANVAQAKLLATTIRRDWDRLGPQWSQLDRFETLAARLSQTEFAIWVSRSGRALAGIDTPLTLERLSSNVTRSLLLILSAALGALLVGPALAALLALFTLHQANWRRRTSEARAGLAVGLCILLPNGVLHAPERGLLCALLSFSVSSLSACYLLHRELSDRVDWRSQRVLLSRPPIQRLFAMLRWLAPSIPTFAPIFVAEVILWVTCIELSSGRGGVGSAAVLAYKQGDIDFLVVLSLSVGLLTAALQLIADAALGDAQWQKGES